MTLFPTHSESGLFRSKTLFVPLAVPSGSSHKSEWFNFPSVCDSPKGWLLLPTQGWEVLCDCGVRRVQILESDSPLFNPGLHGYFYVIINHAT